MKMIDIFIFFFELYTEKEKTRKLYDACTGKDVQNQNRRLHKGINIRRKGRL